MVVPGNPTVFSRQARDLFEKHCASCHSKDGRAQTAIARQRNVRDLSESRLIEGVIVEQILEGTRNKANTFKMPPFKEKLSRAEIASLVPMVKAFRPASPEQENHAEASPRLAGIITFPNQKFAIIEKLARSGRYFLLRQNESHDGLQLAKLLPDQGAVRLSVSGQGSPITLKLDSSLMQLRESGRPGSLRRHFNFSSANHYSLALDNANTDLVLFLYARLTGRTLLRSPHVPATNFSLSTMATTQGPITISVERMLAEKGITVIPDGKKFAHVVLDSESSLVNARSAEIKSMADSSQPAWAAGGVFMNLSNAELDEVAQLHTALTGRPLDSARRRPAGRKINLTTQTALSAAECGYALETLLDWHTQ